MALLFRPLILALLLPGAAAIAGDWPHLRGPATDGSIAAEGVFDAAEFGLELDWQAKIGSSYSGVVVAEDRVVTMFAEGESDWVAAFDPATGREVWREQLGEITKGFDGADDGPLSSPVAGGGRVHALSPGGRLAAFSLAGGKLIWEKQLVKAFEGTSGHFGFATTPLYADGILIVQAGGEKGKAIVGLDAKTGKKRWAQGDDKAVYQTPALMTLAGRKQVVAVGPTRILGLAPDTGEILWEQKLEEERTSSSTPTYLGEDRFLTLMSSGATAYRVARSGESFKVEELYRSEALGKNYAPPVYHEGHAYGFRGQILTCMRAADGERVWRSREPGGDGLILVNDKLVVFGGKGNVVVTDASPDGYAERARFKALGGSSLTWPSFSEGRIYVRNLESLTAVRVTSVGAPVVSKKKTGHGFGKWVRKVGKAGDPQTLVDTFWGELDGTPLVEGDWVHFLFKGEATEVAVAGSMNETEGAEPLSRIEGTDLFHRSYRLEPGSRWQYRFQVDFEEWKLDPNNDRSVPASDGEDLFSEVMTGEYRAADFLEEPGGPRGRRVGYTLSSKILGYDKKILVWLPPRYDEGEGRYPLIIVSDGETWIEKGLMPNSLDNLVGKAFAPAVVAFVPQYSQWWLEAGGSRTEDYVRMLGEELLPDLQQRYRLQDEPQARALLGTRFFAVPTAYAALKHPEIFGKVAIQSAYLGMGYGDDLVAAIAGKEGSGVEIYFDWNRYDERNVDRDWNLGRDSRDLAAAFEKNGYRLTGGEMRDSYGWSGWRNRTDRMLAALYPVE